MNVGAVLDGLGYVWESRRDEASYEILGSLGKSFDNLLCVYNRSFHIPCSTIGL
jgi:hypothetical protein